MGTPQILIEHTIPQNVPATSSCGQAKRNEKMSLFTGIDDWSEAYLFALQYRISRSEKCH